MEFVKIPKDLFLKIALYFLADMTDNEGGIREAPSKKVDALVRHDLYMSYKTAQSPEEREMARLQYLDSSDIARNFRW